MSILSRFLKNLEKLQVTLFINHHQFQNFHYFSCDVIKNSPPYNSAHSSNGTLISFCSTRVRTNDYVIKFTSFSILKLHFVSYSLQSLEKFSGQTTLVAHHLEAFMRQIHDTEFPNSVEATEQLLIEQGTEYNKLKVGNKICAQSFVGGKVMNKYLSL